MNFSCLIVNLTQSNLPEESWALFDEKNPGFFSVRCDYDKAMRVIAEGQLHAMVVFIDSLSPELESLLNAYARNIGTFSDLQAIVVRDQAQGWTIYPSLFELGIEHFIKWESWPSDFAKFLNHCRAQMETEPLIIQAYNLVRALAQMNQAAMKQFSTQLGEFERCDYFAAFFCGRMYEVTGDFVKAVASYRKVLELNPFFAPAQSRLAENLMVLGEVQEAVALFEKLEQINPHSLARKAALSIGYDSLGQKDKSLAFAEQAKLMDPSHPRVKEIQTLQLLAQGKVADALQMMDGISDAGAFFAAKLNEMGIELSKAGHGKQALDLYHKVHKVVRAELRFKISLNAALACHRMNDPVQAMVYLERSQKEYGGSFEKLEKIRAVLKKTA